MDKIEEKLASLSLMSDKDYVRRKLLKALDDAKSDMFIEERAKRCPRCWAPMQVSDFVEVVLDAVMSDRLPVEN